MTTPTAADRIERLDLLLVFLTAVESGGEPLGPSPLRPRRSPTTAAPALGVGEIPATHGGRVEGAAPPHPWPELPLAAGRTVAGDQVREAARAILASPAICGDGEGAGLTTGRVRAALAEVGVDPSNIGRITPALALWLAEAGALAEPESPVTPWAAPRPLVTTEELELQRRLRLTPPPSPEAVTAARAAGLR